MLSRCRLRDFQPFRLCRLALTIIETKKNRSLQEQSGGDVQQIEAASAEARTVTVCEFGSFRKKSGGRNRHDDEDPIRDIRQKQALFEGGIAWGDLTPEYGQMERIAKFKFPKVG